MRQSLVRGWVWVLMVLFPVSMVMADATSAMLNGSGNVTINGSPVERAMAVFPGDKVQTGPNSLATLTSEGSLVTVPGNSSLVFSRKNFVNVLCGTALVSTTRGMAVRVSRLVVQPARGEQARFQITQDEGQLQIVAREGTLAVDNGTTTSSLQPGRMMTASATCMAAPYLADDQAGSTSPMPQNQPQDRQNENKRNRKRAGGVPPPGGTSTTTLLMYGAGTAAVAALVVWLTTRGFASSTAP